MRRKFYLTTEFWIVFVTQVIYAAAILESVDARLILCSVAVLVSSYVVSRAICKRNRPSLVKRPFLCSESYFLVTGLMLARLAFINGKVSFDFCILMMTIILASFVVSRGIIKGEGKLTSNV